MSHAQVIRINSLTHLADDMSAAIDSFLSYGRSKNLSECTLNYYRFRLDAFMRFAPDATPASVTPQLIREFLAHETKHNSPSTANHSYISLSAFFAFLVTDGFLETSPMKTVQRVKRRRTVIDTFTQEQVQGLLGTCGKDFAGIRDKAIILTFIDCGLRVSELCGLTTDDIAWNEQTMLVLGKGNVERVVPFGQTTRRALMQYVGRRGGLDTKAVLVSCYGHAMDRHRVREMIRARCKTAGITGVRCSPHTLRHTFAVSYLRAGGDVFSLQKILGHTDLKMTRLYAELADSDVISKHRKFSPADNLGGKETKSRKRIR